MPKSADILVIGGGPAGMVSAITAKKYYPDKRVTVMKNVANGCIPCSIPYMFTSLKDPDENKLGNEPLKKNGIDVAVSEAVSIDRPKKELADRSGETYKYEKLILALGSSPIVPPIKGTDKPGVYLIYKDMDYLKDAVKSIKAGKKVLIIGGGFIGVEFADEIAGGGGLDVHLVEMMPRLLATSFDKEFSDTMAESLSSRGVNVMTDTRAEEILGGERVEKVRLSDGRTIEVDSVILSVGAAPNTGPARDAGLDLGKGKGIWVDEYMRTADPDIFAVGDCACKKDFFTRKNAPVMLASTATAEARIAGANLYKLKVVRENKGTIAVYSTYVNGLALGSAGLTEDQARTECFEIGIGTAEGMDKHPGTLPGASKVRVKLIFSKKSGIILGGQVAGGISCGEMINLIGMAIQQRVSATEFETLQMATHPYLTSAPTVYPVILAAQEASDKI